MKRSSFIWLSLAGTAGLMVPLQGCHSLDPNKVKVLSRPAMLSAVCDVQTIRDIGQAYLNVVPQEADKSRLSGLLMKEEGAADDLGQQLIQQIETDFKSSHTLVLNGWVVSRTEARQSALFSLIQP